MELNSVEGADLLSSVNTRTTTIAGEGATVYGSTDVILNGETVQVMLVGLSNGTFLLASTSTDHELRRSS